MLLVGEGEGEGTTPGSRIGHGAPTLRRVFIEDMNPNMDASPHKGADGNVVLGLATILTIGGATLHSKTLEKPADALRDPAVRSENGGPNWCVICPM